MSMTEEIQELINIYNRVVDDREFERLREIFDDDTQYWLRDLLCPGVDAAIAGLKANFSDGRSTRHWTASTSITELEPGTAQGVSDLFFMETRGGVWVTTIVGRYHDRFRRVNGRWVFAERKITFVPIPEGA
jgi:hypothetical protein